MNNDIKIKNIKNEPLKTEEKEVLVSGLFNMISKENIQFVSKEKYNELENRINNLQSKIDKAIEKLEYYNSGEALYYVPIQDIIDILKEDK